MREDAVVFAFNYLLPAARTVYIGPYGYVATEGSFEGLRLDTERTWHLLKDNNRNEINSAPELPYLKGSFIKTFYSESDISKRQETVRKFRMVLEEWEEERGKEITEELNLAGLDDEKLEEGMGKKIIGTLDAYLSKRRKSSLLEFNKKELEGLLNTFSVEQRKSLKRLFIQKAKEGIDKDIAPFESELKVALQEESDYYEKTQIKEDLISKPRKVGYSYFDFLSLVSYLVHKKEYSKYFSSPLRAYYRVPEQDKSHEVAPSADLLRSLGLDIRGENHIIDLRLYGGEGFAGYRSILHLNEKWIENCDFFAPSTFYTGETFWECYNRE